jgi:hypothetical protein
LLILKAWTTFHKQLPPGELHATERVLDIRNPLDGPVFDSVQDATQGCRSMRTGSRQDGVLNQHGKCRS